jgi:hypothetical protein
MRGGTRLISSSVSMFSNPVVGVILLQNLLFGYSFYSVIYYLPIYFENVCQHTPIVAAALLVPFFVAQTSFSVGSGFYISKYGRYMEVIWAGFALWTL